MAALLSERSKSCHRILRFFTCCGLNRTSDWVKRNQVNLILDRTYSEKCQDHFDILVVGGGVVGLASARELALRHPKLQMAVVEKEAKVAFHQSGHNSGVIHAGIYYKPGTLKAKLCVEGQELAYKYCDEKLIPYKKCGKLIVATNPVEVSRLNDLFERGLKNNVADLKMIGGDEIKDIEPYCEGLKAIHSPNTGIVDWALVTEHYGKDFTESGGQIFLNFEVNGFTEAKESAQDSSSTASDYPVIISSKHKELRAKYVLTCGGLYSDKLSQLSGCSREPRIVPFRGEYLILKPEKNYLVNGNIYPVPDPRLPFLGVHFTPRMDGSVWLGPNAVLALKREGYTWSDFDGSEFMETITYSGFQRLTAKYFISGTRELMRSACVSSQVEELRKFIPELTVDDVLKGPAGVRAQALDRSGNLVDDFVFDTGRTGIGKRVLHCRNAPSPGATSSLAIAKLIADKVESEFELK